jgi:hypothetical protein
MPIAVIIGIVVLIYALTYFYRLGKKGRRSPLTRHLLRSPGESLRRVIEEVSFNIDYYLAVTFFLPVIWAVYLSQVNVNFLQAHTSLVAIFSSVFLITLIFCIYKVWTLLKKRTSLSLGLECELAVGQELSQLMLQGYRVYHDFPAEKFNIDHIIVGHKGVFAIETKGRTKPDKEGGTEEAKVIFDGRTLKFPSWSEAEPIDQTRKQAAWLAEWLSSALGDSVSVHPVLALPGWYIINERPSDVITFSGKKPDYILSFGKDTLSESAIQRIAHQLDQRCRDVETGAYSKRHKEK